MEWIHIKSCVPEENKDVLVTDGISSWVSFFYNGAWIASHPDYRKDKGNEYGCPYLVLSNPTHWQPLPQPPKL